MDGETYDLVIVGGGLVGGSLACALRGSRLRVCSLEAVAADADHQPSYDERVIALSWGSRRILEGMGLWGDIAPGAEPIHRIHVSERGAFGFAHLDCAEQGVEALGYVAPARVLGTAIRGALACAADIDALCPARLLGLVNGPDGVELEVAVGGEHRRLTTRLLAAADGGESFVRNHLGIGVRERPYGHDAIITTVTPDRPQPGVAYERFTDTGPLAMLPMTGGRWSVVWTSREDETAALLGLTDSAFLARLQERFGYRLGGLDRLGRRVAYPLRQVLATRRGGRARGPHRQRRPHPAPGGRAGVQPGPARRCRPGGGRWRGWPGPGETQAARRPWRTTPNGGARTSPSRPWSPTPWRGSSSTPGPRCAWPGTWGWWGST